MSTVAAFFFGVFVGSILSTMLLLIMIGARTGGYEEEYDTSHSEDYFKALDAISSSMFKVVKGGKDE